MRIIEKREWGRGRMGEWESGRVGEGEKKQCKSVSV